MFRQHPATPVITFNLPRNLPPGSFKPKVDATNSRKQGAYTHYRSP